jgi:hypothetical protein
MPDCRHVWRVLSFVVGAETPLTEFTCVRCPAVMAVGRGEGHPAPQHVQLLSAERQPEA